MTAALAVWALGGCLPEGAPPWQVDHPIVAAVRFDVVTRGPYAPPPSRPDRSVAEVLPGDEIRLTPFLIGPDGPLDLSAVAPAWFYCQATFCFSDVSRAAPVRDCEAEPLPAASTCRIGGGATPTLQLGELTSLVYNDPPAVFMVAGTPGGPSTKLCLERLAKLTEDPETLQQCVLIVKPLPVGPPWRLLLLASFLGLPDALSLGSITPLVQSAEPSQYPEIRPFELTIVAVDGATRRRVAGPGETVMVAPGETVTIDAPVNPLDAQLYYQVQRGSGDTLVMSAQFEVFSSSWLFSRALAEPELEVQRITWEVPEDASGAIHGYYLLNDGRTIVWAWLRFEVTTPGAGA